MTWHNEDDGHSSGSSTSLPDRVLPSTIPGSLVCFFTSPVQTATLSSIYLLWATPEREHNGGSTAPHHQQPISSLGLTQPSTSAEPSTATAVGQGYARGRGVSAAARVAGCEHTAHSALDGWEPRRGPRWSHPQRTGPWGRHPLRAAPSPPKHRKHAMPRAPRPYVRTSTEGRPRIGGTRGQ